MSATTPLGTQTEGSISEWMLAIEHRRSQLRRWIESATISASPVSIRSVSFPRSLLSALIQSVAAVDESSKRELLVLHAYFADTTSDARSDGIVLDGLLLYPADATVVDGRLLYGATCTAPPLAPSTSHLAATYFVAAPIDLSSIELQLFSIRRERHQRLCHGRASRRCTAVVLSLAACASGGLGGTHHPDSCSNRRKSDGPPTINIQH